MHPLATLLLLSLQAFQPYYSKHDCSHQRALGGQRSVARRVCVDVRITGSGLVHMPTDPDFEELRTVNFDHSVWESPECIVSPSSAAEVALVLKAITAAGALFTIRSGGHSPNSGWSNIDGGVLIELSRFNETIYDPASTHAIVGTGNRWGAVYSALEGYGRTAVGARLSPVGVGGFLLGGGLSHISNEYGFGCDNVVNYEVVLSNGTIVNANGDSHPDLYWALKGGTSNFGIVTRFTLRTVPMGKVWAGVITYNATQAKDVIDAIYEYQHTYQSDPKSAISAQFISGAGVVLLTLIYASEITSSPAAFSPFDELAHVASTVDVKTFAEFHDEWLVGEASRYNFYATTVDMDKEMYRDISSIITDASSQLSTRPGAALLFVAQPISPSMTAASSATGGNTLGLPANTNMMWVNLAAAWQSPADDTAVISISKVANAKIKAVARAKGLARDFLFMNDAAADQDVLGSYGERSRDGMRAVAQAVDPDGVFQVLQTGGFKLF